MGILIGTFFAVLLVLIVRKILLVHLNLEVKDTLDAANKRVKDFCDNSEMWNLSTYADYEEND